MYLGPIVESSKFRLMSSNNTSDNHPLVGLKAEENTFLVPDVQKVNIVSGDASTRQKGNAVKPDDVFDRDVLIGSFIIESDDTPYVNIAGDFDLFKLYLDSPQIQTYLSSFQLVTFGLVVTVRLVVPGSCYGTYNVQMLCEGGNEINNVFKYNSDDFFKDDFHSSTQDEHAFLNVELKNSVVFELPWEHYLDAWRVKDTSPIQCWRMLIWALAPIQNTVNPALARGTIQVYARMADPNFQNLAFESGNKKERYPTADRMSTKMKNAGGFINKLSGIIPSIAPLAAPVGMGLAAAASVADWFGFTRESNPQLPMPVVDRLFSDLAAVDGQDSSEVVALSVANSQSIDATLSGGQGEDIMSFASLFERWTIIDIISINTASSGYVSSIPVTPYVYGTTLGIRYLTTGGFVGLPFTSWRGGMEYMIYIPSSSNLEGALQVLWTPNSTTAVPAGDPTNRLANVVIDLKGTSRTMIRVGYSKEIPQAQSGMLAVRVSSAPDLMVNGHLLFYMNAPLTAPREGAYSVQVIVMARPAQDMRFGCPGAKVFDGSSFMPIERIQYQSGDGDEEPVTFIDLASSSDYPLKEMSWGDEIKSTRALVQHFSPAISLSTSLTSAWMARVPHFWPVPFNATGMDFVYNGPAGGVNDQTPLWTYFGWYVAAFNGYRGSMRWKFTSETGGFMWMQAIMAGRSNIADLNANMYDTGLIDNGVASLQFIKNDIGAEFTIPGYNFYKYSLVRMFYSYNSGSMLYRSDSIGAAIPNVAGQGYMAAGPDFTVIRYRRIPGIRIRPLPF